MKAIEKISFIGAGNVATHLAKTFHKAGLVIDHIYSRTLCSANSLASDVKAKAIIDLSNLTFDADLYIVSIPDDFIEAICKEIPNGINVVHTSGSIPLNVLSNLNFNNSGILYPLQTFSKEANLDLSNVPFLIESEKPIFRELFG